MPTIRTRGRASGAWRRSRSGARAIVERTAHAVESADPDDAEGTRRAVALALLARERVEEDAVALLGLLERALGMAAFERGRPVERRRRDLGLYLRQAAPDAKLARAAAAVVANASGGIGGLW